jgi:hypothetical protein
MPSDKASWAVLGLLVAAQALGGCAATHTAVAKRNLDVQTRMSDTVFLDPVPPDEQTVYVDIRNTSDRPDFDIAPQVRAAVEARGYRVVEDPRDARFVLQANVLQAGRYSESASEAAYGSRFGGTLAGGLRAGPPATGWAPPGSA